MAKFAKFQKINKIKISLRRHWAPNFRNYSIILHRLNYNTKMVTSNDEEKVELDPRVSSEIFTDGALTFYTQSYEYDGLNRVKEISKTFINESEEIETYAYDKHKQNHQ